MKATEEEREPEAEICSSSSSAAKCHATPWHAPSARPRQMDAGSDDAVADVHETNRCCHMYEPMCTDPLLFPYSAKRDLERM